MTDPKIKIHDFEVKEEEKTEAWLGTNLVPLSVGISLGLIAGWVIHLL